MEVNYQITKDDYIQFYSYQVNYSKVHKNYYNRTKYGPPILFAIILFFIGTIFLKLSKILLALLSIANLIYWTHRFSKTYEKTSRNNALKILDDGDNSSMLGKRKMIIKEDEIEVRTEKITSTVSKEAITDVLIYEDMILVYLSERNVYLVPTRYLTKDEQEDFIEKITANAAINLEYPEAKQRFQMNKKSLFVFFFILIGLVFVSFKGYQMIGKNKSEEFVVNTDGNNMLLPKDMNPEDLPQEKVFQDEHTRSFLQSTEESRSGHYPFLSETGAYEMDLPKDSEIRNTSSYSAFLSWILNEEQEDLLIFIDGPDDMCQHSLTISYNADRTVEDLKEGLVEAILGKNKQLSPEDTEVEAARIFEDRFEQIDQENQTIYLEAPSEFISETPYDPPKDSTEHYGYSAYLFKNHGPGEIHVYYSGFCVGKCEERREEELAIMRDWMLNGIWFVD